MTNRVNAKSKHIYQVEALSREWASDRFEKLDEAQKDARERTHKEGQEYGIFKLAYQTKVPEIVQNIEIDQVM
jgi:hypothetical protein